MSKKTYSEKDIKILLTSEGLKYKIKNSTKKFYVYTIYGPTLGPIYVGKGTSNRALLHEKQARTFLKENPYLPYEDWVKSGKSISLSKIERLAAHLSYGELRYQVSLFTNCETKAFDEEKRLIKLYGRALCNNGVLANIAGGGQGGWYSNKGGPLVGHEVLIETRRKISEALRGMKRPAEFGEKISKALSGRKIPLETRIKMGKSRLGIPRSAETRKKVSESRLSSTKIPRVAVKIHGVVYSSMRKAESLTPYTYSQIVYRTNTGYRGFERL